MEMDIEIEVEIEKKCGFSDVVAFIGSDEYLYLPRYRHAQHANGTFKTGGCYRNYARRSHRSQEHHTLHQAYGVKHNYA